MYWLQHHEGSLKGHDYHINRFFTQLLSNAIKVHRSFSPQYTSTGNMNYKNLSDSLRPKENNIISTINGHTAHITTI